MGDLPAILTVGTNRGEDLTISSHFFNFLKKGEKLSFELFIIKGVVKLILYV